MIEAHLTKTGTSYLVGERVSFADLMWYPWNDLAVKHLMGEGGEEEWKETWPRSYEWHRRLGDRESVKAAVKRREVEKKEEEH